MLNPVSSLHSGQTNQLSPEVQRQQGAKTAQAKQESAPHDSVRLKSVGDQNQGGDSQ